MRKFLALILAAGLLLLGCTSGDDEPSGASTDDADAGAEPSGPAPGVTDDAVKVGVTFVDLEAIREVTNLDHGDYEATYQALIDDINDGGGIHGRTIEPVFAPVNPIGTEASDAACVELTEDEDVFVAVGFFQDDAVLCYVETHETAVVGGFMSPQRLERASAPWYTTEAGSDLEDDAIRTLQEAGELDGKVATFIGGVENEARLEEVGELLEEVGVDVVDTGILDAPDDDVAAQNAGTQVIAERFRAADADTVVLIGQSGLTWLNAMERSAYKPKLVVTGSVDSVDGFAQDAAGRDLSLLEGAVSAGLWDDQFNEPKMQACLAVLAEAGIEVPDPAEREEGEPELHASAFQACRDVALLRALLEAAGEELDYGTLRAAGDDLGPVDIPGDPEPLVYGAPPAADGDPAVYVLGFDLDQKRFVRQED